MLETQVGLLWCVLVLGLAACLGSLISARLRLNDLERGEKYLKRENRFRADEIDAISNHLGIEVCHSAHVRKTVCSASEEAAAIVSGLKGGFKEHPENIIKRLKAEEAQVDLDIKKDKLEKIKRGTLTHG